MESVYVGAWSLVPPVVAIVLALITKEVVFSLEEAMDIVRLALNRANLSLESLNHEMRCNFAVQMHQQYQLNAHQLACALKVPERVIAQALYAARQRPKR